MVKIILHNFLSMHEILYPPVNKQISGIVQYLMLRINCIKGFEIIQLFVRTLQSAAEKESHQFESD